MTRPGTRKTCWKCGTSEPHAVFGRHGDGSRRLYCDACHLAMRRANHADAKEWRNEQRRRAYAENRNGVRDKAQVARKERYAKHGNAHLAQWIKDNPETYRAAQRKKMKRYSAALTDSYVRALLTQHGSPLSRADIPQSLVEAKRAQIMLERAINENRD